MQRRHTIGFAGAIALLLGVASGSPPSSLKIVGEEGACPAPREVGAWLGRLLPQSKLTSATGTAGALDVALADDGASFRVTVAGQQRSFVDPARECTERARNAAVFVALVLDPPVLPEAPPPLPSAEPEPAPREPALDRTTPPRELALEFGPLFEIAPTAATVNRPLAPGLGARLRWGGFPYLAFGIGAFWPASLHFSDADASATRFPLDAVLGLSTRRGPWGVSADLGPTATILSIRGENLQNTERQARLELGVCGSAAARFWLNEKNALFLSTRASFFPKPYALAVRPNEEVGTTPALWLGGSIGVSLQIE